MNERTRRRWLIRAFAALCLAPTAGVILFCIARNLPGYTADRSAQLASLLGLHVASDAFLEPTPGTLRAEGLTITDPETGTLVLRADRVELGEELAEGSADPATKVVVLTIDSAETSAEGIETLVSLADRMLRGRLVRSDSRIDIRRLRLTDSDRTEQFTEVQLSIAQNASTPTLRACFRWEGAAEPARLHVVRHRQGPNAGYQWELDTRDSALPCRLLSCVWPALRRCGEDAAFRGFVWSACGSVEAVDLAGELSEIDLGRLVEEFSGYRFSARANIIIRSARFRDGRMEEGVFTLSAGPGLINRDLMEMLVSRLKTPRAAEPVHPGELVSFEQLAFHAVVDRRGLRLHGCCVGPVPGAVLCDHRGPLLLEPILQPQPLAAVVGVFAPDNDMLIPMNRRAEMLTRVLPLPEPVPPQQAPVSLSHRSAEAVPR